MFGNLSQRRFRQRHVGVPFGLVLEPPRNPRIFPALVYPILTTQATVIPTCPDDSTHRLATSPVVAAEKTLAVPNIQGPGLWFWSIPAWHSAMNSLLFRPRPQIFNVSHPRNLNSRFMTGWKGWQRRDWGRADCRSWLICALEPNDPVSTPGRRCSRRHADAARLHGRRPGPVCN